MNPEESTRQLCRFQLINPPPTKTWVHLISEALSKFAEGCGRLIHPAPLMLLSCFCHARRSLLPRWLNSRQWREFSRSLGGEGHCNPPRGGFNALRPSEASAAVSISNGGAIGACEGHLVLVV